MEIFKLFGSVLIDNNKANQSIDETDNKGKKLGDTFAKGIETAGKWGLAIGAAATAAGLAMLGAANKTAEYADGIDKLSERTGIGREELQRWKYAIEQSGGNVDKLEVGIKKLSDQMDAATNGNKTSIESFERLGISMEDLKGKTPDEAFNLVASKLADMEQGAERNALGNDVLGKSYTDLLPLLNAGSEGIGALKDRADELGIVMSESAVKEAVVYGDTMADVQKMFGSLTQEIGTAAIPILQKLLEWVIEYMPVIQEWSGKAFTFIGGVLTFVVEKLVLAYEWFNTYIMPVLKTFYDYVIANWPAMQKTAKETFDPIIALVSALWHLFEVSLLPILKLVFGYIRDNWPQIKRSFEDTFKPINDLVTGTWKALELVVTWSAKAIEAVTKFLTAKSKMDNQPGTGSGSLGLGGNMGAMGLNKSSATGLPQGFKKPTADNPMGLAEGGTILSPGRVLVGERGPEFLDLPVNAKVTPLEKAGGINITITGNTILGDDDPAMEKIADSLVRLLARKGVYA